MSGTLTPKDRQALREAIDARRRETIAVETGLIDFPTGSRLLHGTEPGYRTGCRCQACTGASRANRRERRRKLGR